MTERFLFLFFPDFCPSGLGASGMRFGRLRRSIFSSSLALASPRSLMRRSRSWASCRRTIDRSDGTQEYHAQQEKKSSDQKISILVLLIPRISGCGSCNRVDDLNSNISWVARPVRRTKCIVLNGPSPEKCAASSWQASLLLEKRLLHPIYSRAWHFFFPYCPSCPPFCSCLGCPSLSWNLVQHRQLSDENLLNVARAPTQLYRKL